MSVDFKPLELKDIHDQTIVNILSCFITIISCIGISMSLALLVIISYCSPPTMIKFRWFLLAYIFFVILLEIEMLLYKLYVILPYGIFYPIGLLAPMSATMSVTFETSMSFTIAGMMIIILLMAFERYFALIPFSKFYQKPKFYISYYVILFVIYIIVSIVITYKLGIFLSPEEVKKIIEKYIQGGEVLLEKQPSLSGFPTDAFKIFITFGVLFFMMVNIAIPGIITLILGFRIVNKSKSFFARQSNSHHIVLLRLIMFQGMLFILMIGLPLLIAISAFITKLHSSVFFICMCVVSCFPIFDFFIIIFTIKPYRQAIIGLLSQI